MTSAPSHPPVIFDDGVYAPILRVLLGLMTDDERLPVEEILRIGSRSESEELRERRDARRAAEKMGVEA